MKPQLNKKPVGSLEHKEKPELTIQGDPLIPKKVTLKDGTVVTRGEIVSAKRHWFKGFDWEAKALLEKIYGKINKNTQLCELNNNFIEGVTHGE